MTAHVTASEVEEVVRKSLVSEGYVLSPNRVHGEGGADIIAVKGSEKIFIEAIAWKSSGPARAKDFYEVFFRAVARLKDGATKCVIALSSRALAGFAQRTAYMGVAWNRIGTAFPELETWLVNVEEKTVEKTKWNSWRPT